MPEIILETLINAPVETCFDLIRDPRLHTQTATRVGEAAGKNLKSDQGVGLGQTVTFESRNFGMRQRFTVKVVEFERPRLFVDEMVDGKFAAFKHIHEFEPKNGGTLMRDTLIWTSPFGILGRMVDKLFLEEHLRRLVSGRNARLKAIAESGT